MMNPNSCIIMNADEHRLLQPKWQKVLFSENDLLSRVHIENHVIPLDRCGTSFPSEFAGRLTVGAEQLYEQIEITETDKEIRGVNYQEYVLGLTLRQLRQRIAELIYYKQPKFDNGYSGFCGISYWTAFLMAKRPDLISSGGIFPSRENLNAKIKDAWADKVDIEHYSILVHPKLCYELRQADLFDSSLEGQLVFVSTLGINLPIITDHMASERQLLILNPSKISWGYREVVDENKRHIRPGLNLFEKKTAYYTTQTYATSVYGLIPASPIMGFINIPGGTNA